MYRNHNETERLAVLAGTIRECQILKAMGRNADFEMDEGMRKALHRATVEGVKGGNNRLFRIARWQVQRNIGNGLPGMLWPDILHTLLKGMIEVVCGMSLQIVQRISKVDPAYKTSMGRVDKAMANMLPTMQAFFPVRPYAFTRGIFDLIKDKALHADKPVSSFMLGMNESLLLFPNSLAKSLANSLAYNGKRWRGKCQPCCCSSCLQSAQKVSFLTH